MNANGCLLGGPKGIPSLNRSMKRGHGGIEQGEDPIPIPGKDYFLGVRKGSSFVGASLVDAGVGKALPEVLTHGAPRLCV